MTSSQKITCTCDVQRIYSIDSKTPIHMDILWSGQSNEQFYNIQPCATPICLQQLQHMRTATTISVVTQHHDNPLIIAYALIHCNVRFTDIATMAI